MKRVNVLILALAIGGKSTVGKIFFEKILHKPKIYTFAKKLITV